MDAKRFLGVIAWLISMLLLGACATGEDGKRDQPATSQPEPPQILYVAASAECGTTTPCYRHPQDAVDAAPAAAVIKIARGVYTSTESQVLSINKAVQLVGGYTAGDWSELNLDAGRTVLDAGGVPGRRGVVIDGTDFLTITLRGLEIRRGHARDSDGGGIHVAGGSVVLQDSSILSCTADFSGGGLYVSKGHVILRHNLVRGNSARYGGGLYVEGGQVSLEGGTFIGNQAGPAGGAIALGGGTLTGSNVTVVQNALAGAGVYLCGGHLTASHWTLADNGRYGVIAHLGIDIDRGSARLRNSIVASHTIGVGGAGAAAHQTLFYDVNNPCMGGASCVSNLFGDPRFEDPRHGDYHIKRDSAAVDQGYGLDVSVDMDGEVRPEGSASDIGADEVDTEVIIYLPLIARHSAVRVP